MASDRGFDAVGIELLPVRAEIIETRMLVSSSSRRSIEDGLKRWREERPWATEQNASPFPHLRITEGAFPRETERDLGRYVSSLRREKTRASGASSGLLPLVFEEIGYTRKGGQYLRWDHRLGRKQGAGRFDKGPIRPFDVAIRDKLARSN